ncbi:MAG: class I SAM-dependent methyltransferase [Pseudomonadota bacterium]
MAYARTDWFAWVASYLDLAAGSEVLDAGCGPAWLWQRAPGRIAEGLSLTLLDTSPGMVGEARANLSASDCYARIEAAVADAADIPFPDGHFDAVLLMHMLYHTDDPAGVLAEARRVLRPGGKICVTLNGHDDLQEITDLIVDVFGSEPMDFAAARIFLDDAEGLMTSYFEKITRYDLMETYDCTDPDLVQRFILSMPPAKVVDAEPHRSLRDTIRQAFARGGGRLAVRKHTGLIVGRKRPDNTMIGAF